MNPCNVLCYLLLSLNITAYIVIAVDSPSRSSLCHPDQRDTLLQLKNSFSITKPLPSDEFGFCANTAYPKTDSWREDGDCCSWEGVACDNSTGHIVGLDLSCARLCGVIDSNSSLFSLRHLRSISLSGNDLIGSSIPPQISVFSQMTYLNLSSSTISGIVPAEISQLSKLVSLDLYDNELELQNPTMRMLVENLTRLEDLDLTYVNMSAVIPTSLMNFSSSLISLHLHGNWLRGTFPDYIFQLPNLQQLDVSSNLDLHGTLLKSNWSSRLTSLNLSWNNFTGGVSNSIGTLTRLTSLDLSMNSFTGDVDLRTLSALKNLRFLWLSGLSVSGEDVKDANHTFPKLETLDVSVGKLNNFPCFLSGMPELRELSLSQSILGEFPGQCVINDLSFPHLQTFDMSYCNLTKFPSFLSQSKKLRFLDLRSNRVEEIPSWFWGIGIDTLVELDLQDNLFKGGFRLPWKRLDILSLRNNSFEGPFPIPISRSISEFSLSQNRFNGSIPLSICQLTHLQDLDLSQNNLTGVIPQCLSNLIDLRELDLSSNSLTGPLPLPSYAMNYYSVSNNNFSGELSTLLCNATNLWLLDMSNNGLTGSLPRCLKDITMQLEYLNLRVNGFQGSIPDIFHEQCSLKSLDFSRNQFDGSLQRSLSNCQSLEALDVGSNKIVDSFPDWLGNLPLKVLNLRSNEFLGQVSISEGTRSFSSIRILDISNNGFDGRLPDNLITETFGLTRGDGSNGYMSDNGSSEYYSVMIDLKGVEIEMVKINVQFATLDLSCNRFCGEIPRNIGLLKSLKGLNFSHNSFTGIIPQSIGNLTNLESLDFSSNNLDGEIPKELVQLTYLGALNLSRNNLTGPIPSGGHFNTFSNSSFEGNPGLCGIPLTRACGQGHSEAQSRLDQRDDREDEAGGWLKWKFVVMGFGSGMGIGISLGHMALEAGRPLWLAKIIIRLESGVAEKGRRGRHRGGMVGGKRV